VWGAAVAGWKVACLRVPSRNLVTVCALVTHRRAEWPTVGPHRPRSKQASVRPARLGCSLSTPRQHSVLSDVWKELHPEGVGSDFPTYVAVANSPDQQQRDKKIIVARGFNERIRIEVLTAEAAVDKGLVCETGTVFQSLELYQRHADPADARYYVHALWAEEMDKEEAIQVEALYYYMGARKVCAAKVSSSNVTSLSVADGGIAVTAGIVGALSADFEYSAKSVESLAEKMTETWPWNQPTQLHVAMPGGYFVEKARVLGKSVSTTPWELAVRFEKAGRATTTAVIYVSSIRSTASQSKAFGAGLRTRIKGIRSSLGGARGKSRAEDSSEVSVYVISFWQKDDYNLRADLQDETSGHKSTSCPTACTRPGPS